MISEAGAVFKEIVRKEVAPKFVASKDYLSQRIALEEFTSGTVLPDDIVFTAESIGGVQCEWVTDSKSDDHRILIHIHGGGCRLGSPKVYRGLTSKLAVATNAKLLVPDFRLAPENKFPAGIEDVVAVYESLISRGVPADQIMLSGDSGGGVLLLGTLVMLKDKGIVMPKAVICISPMTDATCSGDSYVTQKANDPWLTPENMYVIWKQYCPDLDPRLPLLSPLFADCTGFPPMLIQVGEHEILRDDSLMMADKATADGVDVTLNVYEEMWHVFHAFGTSFPEGAAAFKEIGDFVEKHMG